MGNTGKFSITVDAGYQLKFRQTMDDLLKPIVSDPDYEDVRNSVRDMDRDTGIVSVRTTLTMNEPVNVNTSDCYQNPPCYDRADGQWYPGDYNDEIKLEYDAGGIIKDLKSVLKKMNPVGQVSIRLNSVRTDDYETDLSDKFVGCL